MNVLAIDTATRLGSIALVRGNQLIAETVFDAQVTHAERLLPAIDSILKRAGWELSALNALSVTIGPGSFTGLRVGLATLKGFAQVCHLPLVGVSSLLALAHNGILSEEPVAAIMDAKRGEVYASVYQFHSGILHEIIIKEQAIKPDLLCKLLSKLGRCWLLGDGALAYQKLFLETLGEQAFSPPPPLMRIHAKWVAWLAKAPLQRGEGKNWAGLVPNYLRLSDAENKKYDSTMVR